MHWRYSVGVGLAAFVFALTGTTAESTQEADSGEVWVTSQGTDRMFIVHGHGSSIETISLPGLGPHITNFSPLGDYAYVSGMRNGDLAILRADDRQVIRTLDLGATLTHQARPSPDGSVLLVAQVASRTLIKVSADEAAEVWQAAGGLVFPPGTAPICSLFRADGQRAYVSMLPTGIAIVDVPTMTQVGTLATDGFIACGMTMSKRGRIVTLASSGGGGHVYRLDTATDTLTDAGTLGAADWHSFHMNANEKVGFGTSTHSDELIFVDLTRPTVSPIATLALDPTPGVGNDQPDAINPGLLGNTLFVSLRASGQLAIVQLNQRTVTYVPLSPPAPFNPANCGPAAPEPPSGQGGCAVHGVTVRP